MEWNVKYYIVTKTIMAEDRLIRSYTFPIICENKTTAKHAAMEDWALTKSKLAYDRMKVISKFGRKENVKGTYVDEQKYYMKNARTKDLGICIRPWYKYDKLMVIYTISMLEQYRYDYENKDAE